MDFQMIQKISSACNKSVSDTKGKCHLIVETLILNLLMVFPTMKTLLFHVTSQMLDNPGKNSPFYLIHGDSFWCNQGHQGFVVFLMPANFTLKITKADFPDCQSHLKWILPWRGGGKHGKINAQQYLFSSFWYPLHIFKVHFSRLLKFPWNNLMDFIILAIEFQIPRYCNILCLLLMLEYNFWHKLFTPLIFCYSFIKMATIF